jgi:uncharacterized protein YndB with AHSA1/START domain
MHYTKQKLKKTERINKTQINKDLSRKQIQVSRELDAPIEEVWDAWTNKNILDTWWAPKPWKAETKSMDFKEGGVWFYSMVGPEGNRSWCKVEYKTIVPKESFTSHDTFCDDKGNIYPALPPMHWQVNFKPVNGTAVIFC